MLQRLFYYYLLDWKILVVFAFFKISQQEGPQISNSFYLKADFSRAQYALNRFIKPISKYRQNFQRKTETLLWTFHKCLFYCNGEVKFESLFFTLNHFHLDEFGPCGRKCGQQEGCFWRRHKAVSSEFIVKKGPKLVIPVSDLDSKDFDLWS